MNKLEVGSKAPKFSGKTQTGETVSLDMYKGKNLIVFFYPKDNTSGCTEESCSINDTYPDFQKAGYEVVGISVDSVDSHLKFADKFGFKYPLISDEDKKIVNDYGVWVEKSMFGKKYMGTSRTTFIINGKGVITHIIDKVTTKEAGKQLMKIINQ